MRGNKGGKERGWRLREGLKRLGPGKGQVKIQNEIEIEIAVEIERGGRAEGRRGDGG